MMLLILIDSSKKNSVGNPKVDPWISDSLLLQTISGIVLKNSI